jgi:hypothetical protein
MFCISTHVKTGEFILTDALQGAWRALGAARVFAVGKACEI